MIKRQVKRHTIIIAALAFAALHAVAAPSLEEGFADPPGSAKPHTWYHMMNGNVTKEGITRDFEALAEAGIGGVQMFDAGCGVPPGPLKFNSPEWFDMLRHAHAEAKRLGLEICVPNCSGWSSSGGPWNPPENAMKWLVTTETKVKGPQVRWSANLPRETEDHGFYADIAAIAYPTPKDGAWLTDFQFKRGRERKRGVLVRDTQEFAPEQVVQKEREIDLTARMKPNGALEWDVPDGEWTILRIGFICNGRCNHPASKWGRGLEVDKLSAKALDCHFAQYAGRLCDTLGVGKATDNATGFNNILVDSYEVGCQDWTQGLEKTFKNRLGYSITPYLPVFAGRIVGSTDETERFLEDFRRLLADLFAENYAGRLVELCHERGLLCSIEPYGNCLSDDLQYGEAVDIPMSEFWSMASTGPHAKAANNHNARHAAYVGHVWGRRYIGAESFTASPRMGGRWQTTPFLIKSKGDRVYAEGVNRIIYHRFTHQPWPEGKYLPGMTMGPWGMHLDRTQTWWHLAPAFFKYQSRCQWMLQEGRFVADDLYWRGESAPNAGVNLVELPKGRNSLPKGYAWDFCATKAMERLTVRNGKVVVPGGVEYSILVLPETDTMSERMVRRIGELVEAGAKVVAPCRPMRSPGLSGGKDADARLRKSVAEVWTKGVMECTVAEALAMLGISPDVSVDAADAAWIHRRDRSADWYFVARNNETNVSFEVSFRTVGRTPEIWDAETGRIRLAPVWCEDKGHTFVTLDFKPSGSAFVVFRRPAAKRHLVAVRAVDVNCRPDPVLPEKRHTLVVKKAEYGVFSGDSPKCIDVTDKMSAAVKDGRIDIVVNNALAGNDPLWRTVKQMRVTYVYDGEETTAVVGENVRFRVPADILKQPPPVWGWSDEGVVAWQPMKFSFAGTDGSGTLSFAPPAPVHVSGPWKVAFPAGWDAPAETTFDTLIPWNEHDNDGIRYFSGTATYTKRLPASSVKGVLSADRVMLDLGVVKDFAEVSVNGRKYQALWKPPFRLDVTDAVRGTSAINLEIKVTNLWPNRLIGDDRLYGEDCEWNVGTWSEGMIRSIKKIPQWVQEGRRSPTGRHTFTTWKHWSKEDALLPSGLIGPVLLRGGTEAAPKE